MSTRSHWFANTLLSFVAGYLLTVTPSLSAIVMAQTTLQVSLQDSSIRPTQIVTAKGEVVSLTVVNQGKKVHNFVVPDFYIFTQNLNPGEQVKLSFTPDKTGAFPYYSDTGGKPEPGVRGTMRVHN